VWFERGETFANLIERVINRTAVASAREGRASTRRSSGKMRFQSPQVGLRVHTNGAWTDEDGLRRDAEVAQADLFAVGELRLGTCWLLRRLATALVSFDRQVRKRRPTLETHALA
jgi:hypothetical protein